MLVEFVRCYYCGRYDEINRLLERGQCICTAKRFAKTTLTPLELCWFSLWNPSFLVKAIKEEFILWKQ